MTEQSDGHLLDLIYDAAVDSALWSAAIQAYADRLSGTSAWLSQLSVEDGSGGSATDPTARLDPEFASRYAEYFATRNPLHHVNDPAAYLRRWRPIILTDEDWMPKSDLVRSEFYNDFLRPQDVGSTLMIRVAARGSEIAVLNINRAIGAERFGSRDKKLAGKFQPHLIRAFNLGRKLTATLRLGGDLAGVLDLSPYGLMVLDSAGRIRHANRAAEALLREPGGLCSVSGRLCAWTTDATKRLHVLVGEAAQTDPETRGGGSMALPTATRQMPLAITVAPVRSQRLATLNEGPAVLVCVTDLEAGVTLPEQRLRELFGLTGAEARLATAIFEGSPQREAAASLRISANTAKVHLARIFEKTGVNRQSDLVALMMRTVGAGLE